MKQQVVDYIHKERLFKIGKDRLLLAVSGGVDSMVMLHLLQQLNQPIAVAHCNFSLRGKEADADEALVKAYCLNHGITYHSNQFDTTTFASEEKISIQMAARQLRYNWLNNLVKEYSYNYIATAHHLNDNVETLLLNLVKGTGINGLVGIAPKKDNVIRPLLFAKKNDLYTYAEEFNIPFREDASNQSDKYQRNYLRNTVIPSLTTINPNVEEAIGRTISNIRFAQRLTQQQTEKNNAKFIHDLGSFDAIFKQQLLSHPFPLELLYSLLKNYNYNRDQVAEIIEHINGQTGKEFLSQGYRVVLDRNKLLITPKGEKEYVYETVNKGVSKVKVNTIQLKIEHLEGITNFKNPDPSVAYINERKLEFPLIVRSWQPGDYFYPFGLNKKKKLSKFFIDEKLSKIEKETSLVLVSGQKIVWVIGHRIDHRFKTEENQGVVKITVH